MIEVCSKAVVEGAANGREALCVYLFCLFSEKLSEVELRDD